MEPRRLGRVLKELRETRGLTQDQLAKKAKVARPYITMLEGGVKRNPSLATLRRLAKALKVKVGELLR